MDPRRLHAFLLLLIISLLVTSQSANGDSPSGNVSDIAMAAATTEDVYNKSGLSDMMTLLTGILSSVPIPEILPKAESPKTSISLLRNMLDLQPKPTPEAKKSSLGLLSFLKAQPTAESTPSIRVFPSEPKVQPSPTSPSQQKSSLGILRNLLQMYPTAESKSSVLDDYGSSGWSSYDHHDEGIASRLKNIVTTQTQAVPHAFKAASGIYGLASVNGAVIRQIAGLHAALIHGATVRAAKRAFSAAARATHFAHHAADAVVEGLQSAKSLTSGGGWSHSHSFVVPHSSYPKTVQHGSSIVRRRVIRKPVATQTPLPQSVYESSGPSTYYGEGTDDFPADDSSYSPTKFIEVKAEFNDDAENKVTRGSYAGMTMTAPDSYFPVSPSYLHTNSNTMIGRSSENINNIEDAEAFLGA